FSRLVHIQIANVHPGLSRDAVPRLAERVIEGFQSCFVNRKLVSLVQSNPADFFFANPQEVADYRHAQRAGSHTRQAIAKPLQKAAPPAKDSGGLWRAGGVCSLILLFDHLSNLHEASSATRSVTSWSVSGAKLASSGRSPA